MRRFVFAVVLQVFFLFMLSTAASAAPEKSCDQVLANEILSPAQSYIKIISYSIAKLDDRSSAVVVSRVLKSKEIINPFVGRIDSLSVLLAAAVDKLMSKLSNNDLAEIKKSIRALTKKNEAESADRGQKEAQTALVLGPEVVDRIDVVKPTKGAWHTVGHRTFFVVGSNDATLYLYELINSKLKLVDTQSTEKAVQPDPVWKVINGRVFLAVGSYNRRLYLYELVGEKLQPKGSVETIGWGQSAPLWQVAGDRVFLVLGTTMARIYLFELVEDRLIERDIVNERQVLIKISGQTIDGRTFLAAGTGIHLYLYEIVDGRLIERASDTIGSMIDGGASWRVVGDRVFLSLGSWSGKLFLHEVVGDKLVRREGIDLKGQITEPPEWHVVGGRNLLAVVDGSDQFYLFELINGRLQLLSKKQIKKARFSGLGWYRVDNRVFLSVVVNNGAIHFYELFGNEFEFRSKIEIDLSSDGEPSWLNAIHKGIFLAIGGSLDQNVHLIRAFKFLEKPGGLK